MSKLVLFPSGNFYRTTGKDAIIIHNLLGYKMIADKNDAKLGEYQTAFPREALGKVSVSLTEAEIPFVVYDGDKSKETSFPGSEEAYKKYSRLTPISEIVMLLEEEAKIYQKKFGVTNRRKSVLFKEAAQLLKGMDELQ